MARSGYVLDNEGHVKQKQESADTVLKTEEGGERPSFPVKTSIARDAAESKENNAAVQKTVRFALGAPVEMDTRKDLVAVNNLTEQNLREALELVTIAEDSIMGSGQSAKKKAQVFAMPD